MRWAVLMGALAAGVSLVGGARAQEEGAGGSGPDSDSGDPQPAPAPQPPPQPPPYGYGYPPYGYGYPPYGYGYGYPYPARPAQPPKKLPYREGEPAPAGYHFDTQLRKGLIIAGSTTFGATYILSVAVAAAFQDDETDSQKFVPLFVPLAGPFITVGTADSTAFATFILVLDGLAQTLGVGMFIAGVSDPEKIWVRDGISLELRPLLGPGVAGLALGGNL